ncbi:type I-E CRISPR-associated protein Cas5/CasD [Zobellella taiwanensis]|uniref:Type I-E CRISPR-associated protein Cas5/CasD n=1 Tax=Zobellella taiwanensis TaxID=347535 RepID=A0A2P7R9P5_9GAMM|nr:type I-E CRISPR-associated protein Cas5/CasD [Zobellella taiwanensis]PSJ46958.1 type I-E CRISPR-associated protein Cas5/CasD [Zobellella taiwanensis]
MDYLLFRLYGPMASWGDIAVGESRHSLSGPTKTAIMGLVVAALGIRREEEATHLAFNRHYSMATAVWSKGQLLRDYHTVQAPDSVGKFRYRTRRDELTVGRDRLGTVLSSREYRTDALAWVALKADEAAPFTLEQLASALNSPKFVLYLGRKSCPLAAPLAPTVTQANGFYQAFRGYAAGRLFFADPHWRDQEDKDSRYLPLGHGVEYFWEGEFQEFAADDELDASSVITLTQHDQLLSRLRWQFSPRKVHRFYSMEG